MLPAPRRLTERAHVRHHPGPAGTTEPTAQQTPPLVVNIQYVKDLSFEVPGAPGIFTSLRTQPQVAINLDVQARRVHEGQTQFEVSIIIRAEAHDNAHQGNGQTTAPSPTVFVAELTYAGVFTLSGLPENAIEPVLLVECPRILFPFARNILADVTRDGGFPPVLLQPIDFVAFGRPAATRPPSPLRRWPDPPSPAHPNGTSVAPRTRVTELQGGEGARGERRGADAMTAPRSGRRDQIIVLQTPGRKYLSPRQVAARSWRRGLVRSHGSSCARAFRRRSCCTPGSIVRRSQHRRAADHPARPRRRCSHSGRETRQWPERPRCPAT